MQHPITLMQLLLLLLLSCQASAAAPSGPIILPLDSGGTSLQFSNVCHGDVGFVATLLTAPTLGPGAFSVAWGDPSTAVFSQPGLGRVESCRLPTAGPGLPLRLSVAAFVAANGTAWVEIQGGVGSSVCRFVIATTATTGDGGGGGGDGHGFGDVDSLLSPHFLAVGPFDGCVETVGGKSGGGQRHCFVDACRSPGSPSGTGAPLIRHRRAASTCKEGDCKNRGVCNPFSDNPHCICIPPYIAPDCTTIPNFCNQTQAEANITLPVCYNAGTCNQSMIAPYFNCTCSPGYSGRRCETDINDCVPDPCANGMCKDLVNNYTCTCYSGWTGRSCSDNIDDCVNKTVCSVRDRCLDGNNTCTCKSGWRGSDCSLVDHCALDACPNGTACVNLNVGEVECKGASTFSYNQPNATQTPLRLAPNANFTEPPATLIGSARTRMTAVAQLLLVETTSGRQLSLSLRPPGQLTVSLGNQSATVTATNASLTTGDWFSFNVSALPSGQLLLTVTYGNMSWAAPSSNSSLPNDTSQVSMVTLGAGFKGCLDNVRLNSRLLPLANWSQPTAGVPGFAWLSNQSATSAQVGCLGDLVCGSRSCNSSSVCVDLWNDFSCRCGAGYSGPNCSVVNCSIAVCATTTPSASAFATAGVSTPVVVVICVLALIVVLVIITVLLVKHARSRRSESGQYKPSSEESYQGRQNGARDATDTDLDNNFVLDDIQVARL